MPQLRTDRLDGSEKPLAPVLCHGSRVILVSTPRCDDLGTAMQGYPTSRRGITGLGVRRGVAHRNVGDGVYSIVNRLSKQLIRMRLSLVAPSKQRCQRSPKSDAGKPYDHGTRVHKFGLWLRAKTFEIRH